MRKGLCWVGHCKVRTDREEGTRGEDVVFLSAQRALGLELEAIIKLTHMDVHTRLRRALEPGGDRFPLTDDHATVKREQTEP